LDLIYGFYPLWGSDESHEVTKIGNLPFVIQLESDYALFLLVEKFDNSNLPSAYFSGVEIWRGADKPPLQIRMSSMPIEWIYKPELATYSTSRVTISFDSMEKDLARDLGDGTYSCRIIAPIWKLNSASTHFIVVTHLLSTWFNVRLHTKRIVGIFSTNQSFRSSGGQSLKYLSELKGSPGQLFAPFTFGEP
jgi:hypothetical protein